MDDKVISDNAEYQFNESEVMPASDAATDYKQPEASASEAKQSQNSSSRKPFKFDFSKIDFGRLKRPLIIVGSIAIVYFGFTMFSSKKSEQAASSKITAQDKAAMVQVENKTPVPPSQSAPVVSQTDMPADDMQMSQMQDAIQQKVDNQVEKMQSTAQKSIGALARAIKNIEQDIYTTHQNIEQLTMAMQHMLVDIQKIQEATKPKPKKKVQKPPVAYHVRAIVPGRVWLESAKGKNVTLRVGDKLEGYGAVRVISPRQGMVLMSNGSIIQYGVNDF